MQRLSGDLLRRPFWWPTVARRMAELTLIRRRASRYHVPESEDDIETVLWEHRANWLLHVVAYDGTSIAAERFDALLERKNIANDSYSASQRLAHAAYLARLMPHRVWPTASHDRLIADATLVAEKPEFRLHNDWFNNHLLNNYRGLSLALAQVPMAWPESIRGQLEQLDRLLVRHAATLFDHGWGPVLAEGSVSYELLILRHLFDIICGGVELPLKALAAVWLEDAAAYVWRYRDRERWLLPAIGDLCPDWRRSDIEAFLDGVFLGVSTSYSNLWAPELKQLGLSFCRAMSDGAA